MLHAEGPIFLGRAIDLSHEHLSSAFSVELGHSQFLAMVCNELHQCHGGVLVFLVVLFPGIQALSTVLVAMPPLVRVLAEVHCGLLHQTSSMLPDWCELSAPVAPWGEEINHGKVVFGELSIEIG